MKSRPEQGLEYRRIVEESALPVAPMAMPEQMLARRSRASFLVPLFSWLVSK